ncbi:uncharacterized protein BKA55DRAFT_598278 [Fusarium redolens]|uniref:Uncharacterized protein n=1 Tax=Fusarium redolens TaxID=48865 RepID=A0A9P9G4X7_FUSRE|nr:uncharacterized protein BKA55DRAFT_598278 [Fusarium redolens]KAH7232283.1 hypothetical protein BKA55DRAFT_598278 [Fusarium redolens]
MESLQSKLDILQYGFHALARDFMSLDVDDFIQVVDQLMQDLKDDRKTVREYVKVLQLTNFDAKLAHSKINRDLEFKYPRRSTKDFEHRFKMLELYSQAFADTMVEAGASMSAYPPPLTEIVTMFESVVQDYLKHRHRRISLQLDPQALRYVSRPFSQEFLTSCLRAYRQRFIPRGRIFLKAEEQYDEGNVRTPHPCLVKCKIDFLDREEGVLHWSIGGILAWRFHGEDSWMDRHGHVIVDDE